MSLACLCSWPSLDCCVNAKRTMWPRTASANWPQSFANFAYNLRRTSQVKLWRQLKLKMINAFWATCRLLNYRIWITVGAYFPSHTAAAESGLFCSSSNGFSVENTVFFSWQNVPLTCNLHFHYWSIHYWWAPDALRSISNSSADVLFASSIGIILIPKLECLNMITGI